MYTDLCLFLMEEKSFEDFTKFVDHMYSMHARLLNIPLPCTYYISLLVAKKKTGVVLEAGQQRQREAVNSVLFV